MDLEKFSLEDLLLAAIKSEVESNKIYSDIAKKIKNGLLQDKLEFLAKEEEKHRLFIEEIFKKKFPGKEISIPEKSPVPLPEVKITDEDIPISKVLRSSMQAEQAAHDFYESLSKKFNDESTVKNTLLYFADMELQHYKILEMEKESMERFEEADVYWPMVHVGP